MNSVNENCEKAANGRTMLMIAACQGNLVMVKQCLSRSMNIDEKDNDGNTALIFAASEGNSNIVTELIVNHANMDEKNKIGWTALHYAVFFDFVVIAKQLLDANTNIDFCFEKWLRNFSCTVDIGPWMKREGYEKNLPSQRFFKKFPIVSLDRTLRLV